MHKTFFEHGLAELEAGRFAAAERHFRTAIAFDPSNPRYRAKLAETLLIKSEHAPPTRNPYQIR